VLTVPIEGVKDQLTDVFNAPVTDAMNLADWPACTELEEGVIATATLVTSQTVALPTLLGSATLLANTVTACGLPMVEGAVYNPFTNVPIGVTRDHITPGTFVPLTDASKVADSPAFRDVEDGVTLIVRGLL